MLTLGQSLAVNTGIGTVSSPRLNSDCSTVEHIHCNSIASIVILVPDSSNENSERIDG